LRASLEGASARGGYKHSEAAKSAISLANTGHNNPMFGKTANNALMVYVYTTDNVFVQSFSSHVAAATWLGISRWAVSRDIKSGKVLNNQYLIRNVPQ
jgi:hypothetical protein